ncbi:MAG: type II toxin-antitoxin system VapC family toxin [Defluviitaleaceae bacterium]|nr:type II toxin-antitoxin system VapC family toxin [Defluviitaleaceae bacterium]
MRYLLDTHVIIWMVEDSPNLPLAIREIIKNPENQVAICSISLWEIAIKMNIGKLTLSLTFDELVDILRNGDFDFVQVEDEYLSCLSKLPLLHKDPFDRLLISTAIVEKMTFITIDENIQKYDVPWVW